MFIALIVKITNIKIKQIVTTQTNLSNPLLDYVSVDGTRIYDMSEHPSTII